VLGNSIPKCVEYYLVILIAICVLVSNNSDTLPTFTQVGIRGYVAEDCGGISANGTFDIGAASFHTALLSFNDFK
jgi:hypothetical protein